MLPVSGGCYSNSRSSRRVTPPSPRRFVRLRLAGAPLGGLVDFGPESARLLLVRTGEVLVTGPTDGMALHGPAIGWFPNAPAHRLRARAGSEGQAIVLSDVALASATRRDTAAAAIREVARRRVMLDLKGDPELRTDIEHALSLVLREVGSDRPGAASLVDAQIAVLLVLIWRHAGAVGGARPPSRPIRFLPISGGCSNCVFATGGPWRATRSGSAYRATFCTTGASAGSAGHR
jgi:hypothetical protein